MTDSSIEPFNLTEHIRNKVRETIVAAVPDQQMDAMIQAEFDDFFKGKRGDRWGNGDRPSKLSTIVQAELDTLMRERVRDWLNVNFTSEWENGIESLVGEAVAKLAPIVQKNMILDITAIALSDLRNRL